MRIAMIASEGAPYIKTGGLGDVMQALPAALADMPGNEVCLFLPYYKQIKENSRWQTAFLTSFEIRLGWRKQYVGLFQLVDSSRELQIYFVDNEFYFARESTYGYGDDAERFAYYSKAVLSCLNYLKFRPDVLQCNDWQTALIPLLLRSEFAECFPNTKTLFTIHNVEYQGWADKWFFYDALDLPQWCFERLSMDGSINFMKSAVEMADCITTVSQTYAQELLYPYYAHGMNGIFADNCEKLHGITNGIDVTVFDPATDANLWQNYSVEDAAEGKAANKQQMQQMLGLPQRPEVPVLAMITRLAGHKGIDLLCYELERLMEQDVQLVIVGTGEQRFEQILSEAQTRHPEKLSVNLRFDTGLASQLYAAADVFLMPSKSEPCGLSQMIAMHYGTIPVVNETGGLRDTVAAYNPLTGEGRGFTFQSYNADDFYAAIERCLELYHKAPVQWKALMRKDMQEDFSWRVPAQAYMDLYRKLYTAD